MLRRVMNEDINLTLLPRAEGGFTRIDGGQLEQVLMNLAVNARDAMPRGGRLTIETADVTLDGTRPTDSPGLPAGEYVSITVTDSGVGMPPEVRARVFEPYFTTKEVGKGTGLGLSTVYGIIRQADGDIQLTSEPGVGTTFRVLLPRVEGTEVENGAAATIPLPGGTEQVLLVEDDAGVRRLVKSMLLSVGYSVLESSSGRAALALGSDETRQIDLGSLVAEATPQGVVVIVGALGCGKDVGERLADVVEVRGPETPHVGKELTRGELAS